MTVRRSANFGTYFFIGLIGLLIGSVIGNVLVKMFRPGAITKFINLYGFANKLLIRIGGSLIYHNNALVGAGGYYFSFNLIAIIGIFLAIYIYRRI